MVVYLKMSFFDREQRSKVLKEALLLLLLAWNQAPKMYQIEQKLCKGTKNVQENKNVPKSQNEVHKVAIVMGAKCYIQ